MYRGDTKRVKFHFERVVLEIDAFLVKVVNKIRLINTFQ